MLERQAATTASVDTGVGRVIFLPDAKQDFLFFIPRIQNPTLRLLEDSQWFKIFNQEHGTIYRASTSLEALYWLRDNLGQLNLSPEVNKWRTQVGSVLKIAPIPNLPLFDFQLSAVGFLQERERAMLSLSPGLGKTVSSITAAEQLYPEVKKILVVAPLSLLYMWKAEIEKWTSTLNEHHVIIQHGKKFDVIAMDKYVPGRITWVITNPETATNHVPTFLARNFHLAILDESILYKSRDSKRTKAMKRLAKGIKRVWELTGAPANRMIDDIWSQFNILDPKAYSSYWRFAKEYCVVNPTTWGNQVVANKLMAEEKIKERFKDIYFARSQSEVLDIPDWLFTEIDVPMGKRQEKAYRELSTFFATELENLDEDGTVLNKQQVTVDNHLAKVVRLIQLASNPMLLDGDNESGKWEALPELMEYYPPPFLIWTSFTRTAHYLAEFLGGIVGQEVKMVIGETKIEDRNTYIKDFQEGKKKVLILNMETGSFGHTLTAARTAFYPERNYNSNYFQSLHRVRRIGTVHSPNIVHLRSVYQDGSPTIDHLVHSLLDYRVNMIKDLTTGMLRDIL